MFKDSLYSTFTLQKYKKEVSVQNKFKFILEKEGKKQLFGISEHLLMQVSRLLIILLTSAKWSETSNCHFEFMLQNYK